MRILVADNEAEHRGNVVSVMQSLGHTVQEALSVREVTELCRTKCPDLIFIDSLLSGLAGTDVVKQVRQSGGAAVWVPIVLMGKSFSDQDIERGLDAGADDFLIKPVENIRTKIKIRSAERLKNLKDEVFSVAHDLVIANRALEGLVTQDALTEVGNANSFEDALEREWFKAKRTNTSLALIMIDLDYFQAFNQAYGAPEGDKCIKHVAEVLKANVPAKEGSSLSRIAGETFALLIPEMPREEALKIAEKLRGKIDNLKIPHKTSGCSDHVTASFGAALAEPGNYTSPWDLKEAADFALYQAKHYGRNRSYLEPAAPVQSS